MINANLDILPLLLFFLHKPGRETPTPCIDHTAALFPLDRGVQTQVLSTRETQAAKLFLVAQPLGAELHQRFQLGQGLFDFGHGSRAVDELAVLWVVLLVGDDQGQEGDCLACA